MHTLWNCLPGKEINFILLNHLAFNSCCRTATIRYLGLVLWKEESSSKKSSTDAERTEQDGIRRKISQKSAQAGNSSRLPSDGSNHCYYMPQTAVYSRMKKRCGLKHFRTFFFFFHCSYYPKINPAYQIKLHNPWEKQHFWGRYRKIK